MLLKYGIITIYQDNTKKGALIMNTVITISRQYGSGGRFVAKKLAETLGIDFYDNELITMAAKESGYAESIFQKAEQISSHSLLYSLSMFGSAAGVYGLPLSDKVFIVQSEIIKKCAQKGPCVIVGRCSDYVLRDFDNVIKIFIYSDFDHRVKRAVEYYGVDPKIAQEELARRDKKRATYYNYYTSLRWGDLENYDISINNDIAGVDGTVKILADFVKAYEQNKMKTN